MSVRTYEQISDLPTGITPTTGAELVELEQDGVSRKFSLTELGGVTAVHQGTHQFGSTDPVGTHDKVANAIPYLNASGLIDDHVSDASETVPGKVELAEDGESAAGKAVQSDDGRLSDARTPTGHASSHYGVGDDLIPDATTEASGLMSNADKTKLDAVALDNIPTTDQKAALGGSYGVPSVLNKYITQDDPILSGLTFSEILLGISLVGEKQIGSVNYASLTTLNSNDVVLSGYYDYIGTYRWNGTTYTQIGNLLNIQNLGNAEIKKLTSTTIALCNDYTRSVAVYSFNETDWSLVGTPYSTGTKSINGMVELNSTDVLMYLTDAEEKVLRRLHWTGTQFEQVEADQVIVTGFGRKTSRVSETMFVTYDRFTSTIYIYGYEEGEWTTLSQLTIAGASYGSVTVNSSNTFIFANSAESTLTLYTYKNNAIEQIGTSLSLPSFVGVESALATLTPTQIAFIDETNEALQTYQFILATNGASINIGTGTYIVPDMSDNSKLLIRKISAYDGNALVITPPSGATFEGKASISLYGQYSFVEIERISATLFAIRDIEDCYTTASGSVSIRGKILEQWGVAGAHPANTSFNVVLPRIYENLNIALSGSVIPTTAWTSFEGYMSANDTINIYPRFDNNVYIWHTTGIW